MSKSIYQANEEKKALYKTKGNTYDMFPPGTRVHVVTNSQDFYFFYDETGEVIENSGRYLGINVKFDKPRHFEDGYVQDGFNFEPEDLRTIDIDIDVNL